LNKELLVGEEWLCDDGSTYSLNHVPELKMYAERIELLRVICREVREIGVRHD
jgi:hypothetical protein